MHKYKISTINRHLRKMFTALASIIVNNNDDDDDDHYHDHNHMKKLQLQNSITGFASAAGEKIYFDL